MIHPTAIVDPDAVIADDVVIGPYAVVEKNVSIGPGTVIGPHAVISPFVEIQADCRIGQGAAIGGFPQSITYDGEETHVVIGRGTIMSEFVTVNRGTVLGGGTTQIGEGCYLMAYAHVGHDCIVGNHAYLINNATLGGHVTVGEHAQIGSLTPVQQFCRIGDYAFVGGSSAVNVDIPPYVMAVGNRTKLNGLNTVGLKRHGFGNETISELKKAYRITFRSKLKLADAIDSIKRDLDPIPEIANFVHFLETAERGITR